MKNNLIKFFPILASLPLLLTSCNLSSEEIQKLKEGINNVKTSESLKVLKSTKLLSMTYYNESYLLAAAPANPRGDKITNHIASTLVIEFDKNKKILHTSTTIDRFSGSKDTTHEWIYVIDNGFYFTKNNTNGPHTNVCYCYNEVEANEMMNNQINLYINKISDYISMTKEEIKTQIAVFQEPSRYYPNMKDINGEVTISNDDNQGNMDVDMKYTIMDHAAMTLPVDDYEQKVVFKNYLIKSLKSKHSYYNYAVPGTNFVQIKSIDSKINDINLVTPSLEEYPLVKVS